jgi:predicted nuclease with TOPRIM domain
MSIGEHDGCYEGVMMPKEDSRSLRNEMQELREEASALADRAKKTARLADVLAERIKNLEKQVTDKTNSAR